MATSHVVVIDSTARRAVIKVTPGTYLSDILQQASQKLGLRIPASQYGLKNNNKPVDLSRTIRLSGLTSGAKLELIQLSRSPSVVSVALQLPEGEREAGGQTRLLDKFASTTTLWMILRKFESATGEKDGPRRNFTARAKPKTTTGGTGEGRLFYESPVLHVMGRDLSTFIDLQKTLGQLGFNGGSALLRLKFHQTETPIETAMTEIGQYFKDAEEDEKSGAQAISAVGTASTADVGKQVLSSESSGAAPTRDLGTGNGSQDVSMDGADTAAAPSVSAAKQQNSSDGADTAAAASASAAHQQGPPDGVDISAAPSASAARQQDSSDRAGTAAAPSVLAAHQQGLSDRASTPETVIQPGQRPVSVFAPPENNRPQATYEYFNEADYTPTVEHAEMQQSRLSLSGRNQRLKSDAELKADEQATAQKIASIKAVEIKIRYPDQSQIVSVFADVDTASRLYEFVQSTIEHDDQPFHLKYSSPQGPKLIPREEEARLISDLGLVGRVLVHLVWDEQASAEARTSRPTLKKEFAASAKQLQVEVQNVGPAERDGDAAAPRSAGSAASQRRRPAAATGAGTGAGTERKKGVPKWLKLPGMR